MRPIRILLSSLLLLASCNLPAQESASPPASEPVQENSNSFDYWILSLSWSPQFCAENTGGYGSYGLSDNSISQQCSRNYAFVVHGLWPQYETGYPKNCETEDRVDRALTDRMMPLMPDPILVRHEWREHGACSGIPMNDYFMTIESVYRSFVIPESYREARLNVTTNLLDLKRDFMNANPKLDEDQFVLHCSGRFLREVQVCYDRKFHFRSCGEDVQDRCRSGDIILRPKR